MLKGKKNQNQYCNLLTSVLKFIVSKIKLVDPKILINTIPFNTNQILFIKINTVCGNLNSLKSLLNQS